MKYYAFWKYDRFPGVLGGEVTNMRADGSVETVEYGKGFWFHPFKILPLTEGRQLANKLLSLLEEKYAAEGQLMMDLAKKRDKLITIPKA